MRPRGIKGRHGSTLLFACGARNGGKNAMVAHVCRIGCGSLKGSASVFSSSGRLSLQATPRVSANCQVDHI
eukprot:12430155-Karenia_brevis.AAC.1